MARETRSVSLNASRTRFANGTSIEAPALSGTVSQWTGPARGFRAAMLPAERDMGPEFDAAIEENDLRVQETLHFDVDESAASIRADRRGEAAADRVVVRPAPPPAGSMQVVFYQDESGGMSWHFPDGHFGAKTRRRTRSTQATFTIPTRTAKARAAYQSGVPVHRLRGPVTTLGRKIFKILLVPLSKVIANPLQGIVGKIERRHRQDLIRSITAENYRTHVSAPFDGWSTLRGKRSLLIVHGIFSTTEGMLSGYPETAMRDLIDRYEGRVIGLDQLTVSRSPEDNARVFLEAVRGAGGFLLPRMEFDILCHSRGGIVSRAIAERRETIVPASGVSINKVFFVATPNAGSPLGDARHMTDMIDVFTNLLTSFPDGPVTYALEVLVAIVKLLAYSAGTQLPGIAAMGTGGYIPDVLNRSTVPSPASYAAAASNYEPDPAADNAFFSGRFSDAIIDRVFANAANDLVVPRDGVYAANGHPSFPIENPLIFGEGDHVWHTDFFRHPRTIQAIASFLGSEAVDEEEANAPELGDETGAFDRPDVGRTRRRGGADTLIDIGGFSSGSRAPGRGSSSGSGARGRGFSSGSGAPDGLTLDFRGFALPSRARRRRSAVSRRKPGSAGASKAREKPRAAARPSASSAPKAAPSRAHQDAVTLERDPKIEFHELVRAGDPNDLRVSLNDVVTAGAPTNLLIDLLAEEEEIEIKVSLYAPGFNVKPHQDQTMTVKRERDPETEEVTFRLIARNPGKAITKREIIAEFWHRNASIGSVTHYTNVVPKGYTGPISGDGRSKAEPFAISTAPRQECDLVIRVEGQNDAGQPPFRLKLRVPAEGIEGLDCGVVKLPSKDLGKYLDTAIQDSFRDEPDTDGLSNRDAEAAYDKWDATVVQRLEDLGKQLWTFLPEQFQNEYLRLVKSGLPLRSVRIHSDEMIFPWELVVPHRLADRIKLKPLGIQHVIGRWKPGKRLRPSPQRIPGEKFVVVRPRYSGDKQLGWAEEEERALKKLFKGIEVLNPADEPAVRSLLGRSDVKLLHYSGHGDYDPSNSDLSALVLEQGTSINVLAVANTVLGAQGNPIVYLNACGLGASAMTVGRAGGFASACIDGDYSGLLASYWSINDQSAAKMSVALYRRLLAGDAIGEALRDLRDQNSGDPTFLGSTYFGDPWTRLDLSGLVRSR